MSEERNDPMVHRIRDVYHVPGEVPREAMWDLIAERIGSDEAVHDGPSGGEHGMSQPDVGIPGVVDLTVERTRREALRRHALDRPLGWAVAAAAVLVLGIGIGRGTAPRSGPAGSGPSAATVAAGPTRSAMDLAAREHLDRTESLLTMVRSDGRAGRVDPSTGAWARGLLAETRLLLDADAQRDPAVRELLLDLELVLVQIAGLSGTGDEARSRTELELTLRSLEEAEVLPRIQAALPTEMSGA